MVRNLYLAGAALLLMAGCAGKQAWNLTAGQHPEPLKLRRSTLNDHFLLFIPESYGTEKKQWPVIVFLHGSGECGTDLNKVRVHGPPMLADSLPGFPFIVVTPQALADTPWSAPQLKALVKRVLRTTDADERRVYVTGLSLGGEGSWAVAAAYPHLFAAIAPLCGYGDTTTACMLKELPIWAFHGAKDDIVPLAKEQAMVDAVNRCGGHARLTIYPQNNHNVWDSAYSNPGLYRWMLEQVKREK